MKKNSQWLASALLCVQGLAPPAAYAQTNTADPAQLVPPVVYQSVFTGGPKGVETTSTDWKKANAEVGQFRRGHLDILKWEERQTRSSATPPSRVLWPELSPTQTQVAP